MPDGPEHPETWVFHLAMAWLGNPDHSLSYSERLAMIKERASKLAEPARSAFTWIPDDTPVHKADISYWIPRAWDNHKCRMTLVGDAAHPMPPCEYSCPSGCLHASVLSHYDLHDPSMHDNPSSDNHFFLVCRPRPRPKPLHL